MFPDSCQPASGTSLKGLLCEEVSVGWSRVGSQEGPVNMGDWESQHFTASWKGRARGWSGPQERTALSLCVAGPLHPVGPQGWGPFPAAALRAVGWRTPGVLTLGSPASSGTRSQPLGNLRRARLQHEQPLFLTQTQPRGRGLLDTVGLLGRLWGASPVGASEAWSRFGRGRTGRSQRRLTR